MSFHAESPMISPTPATTAENEEGRERRAKGRLFGRYHKFALTVVSSLLSTLLGAVIGAAVQRRESDRANAIAMARAKEQLRAEQARAELGKALTIHERIATLMDRRVHYTRQLLSKPASQDAPTRSAAANKEMYRKVFNEWNENLNFNISLINQYFGGELGTRFERDIMRRFSNINFLMEKGEKSKGPIEKQLGELRRTIYVFNRDITKSLQERREALVK